MRSVSFAHSDIDGRRAISVTITRYSEADREEIDSIQTVKLFADELAEAAEMAAVDPSESLCPPDYSNIRECIGHFIGRTIEDITQHDRDEFEESRRTYIQFLLSGGDYIKFFIGPDGFQYSTDEE